jgi:hypothetical protein
MMPSVSKNKHDFILLQTCRAFLIGGESSTEMTAASSNGHISKPEIIIGSNVGDEVGAVP